MASRDAIREKLRGQVLEQLQQLRASTSKHLATVLGSSKQLVSIQLRLLEGQGLARQASQIKVYSSTYKVWAHAAETLAPDEAKAIATEQLGKLEGPEVDRLALLAIPDVPYSTTFVGGRNPWKGRAMK